MDICMIVVSVVVTAATTACIAAVRGFYRAFRSIRSTQQALIKDRLVGGHDYFTDKGQIGKFSLDSLETLYSEYKELGGNGFVAGLMEDVRKLPKK